MKTRNGFVSNSSTSSFIIRKENLTTKQVYEILNPLSGGKHWNIEYWKDAIDWDLIESDKYIRGSTDMDNFRFDELFNAMGIPETEYAIDRGYNGKGPGKLNITNEEKDINIPMVDSFMEIFGYKRINKHKHQK